MDHEKWVINLAAQLRENGVDVILDMVGGDYVQQNLDSLEANRRAALVAGLKDVLGVEG